MFYFPLIKVIEDARTRGRWASSDIYTAIVLSEQSKCVDSIFTSDN